MLTVQLHTTTLNELDDSSALDVNDSRLLLFSAVLQDLQIRTLHSYMMMERSANTRQCNYIHRKSTSVKHKNHISFPSFHLSCIILLFSRNIIHHEFVFELWKWNQSDWRVHRLCALNREDKGLFSSQSGIAHPHVVKRLSQVFTEPRQRKIDLI